MRMLFSRNLLPLVAALCLAACGDTRTAASTSASETDYQQLSQVQWSDMIAARTTAKVPDNLLPLMR